MRVIAEQLDRFHKCRGKPCYQYVNPYSVIVTEERELYFLDLGAESNEEMLRKMQQRDVYKRQPLKDCPIFAHSLRKCSIFSV